MTEKSSKYFFGNNEDSNAIIHDASKRVKYYNPKDQTIEEEEFETNLDDIFLETEKQGMQFITLQNWEDLDLDEKLFQNVVGPPFGFFRPSKIQAFSLPLIMQEPYENLIAQAHNGSGKTVAFALGSLSHVDPYKDQLQVICVAHSRELIIQNFDVYKKISKNTGIRVNVMLSYKECPQIIGHVLIATPSTLE